MVSEPPDQNGETPVTVTYEHISTDGNTFLTVDDQGPPAPDGFQVGDSFYHLSSTAGFSGNLEICVEYDEGDYPGPESMLALLHYEDTVPAWVDITSSLDIDADIVCGIATSFSPFALAVPEAVTAIGEGSGQSGPLRVGPNPFRASTAIRFELERSERVSLGIFDVGGRQVRRLVDDVRPAGEILVRWDGRSETGVRLPPGIYYVRLLAEGQATARKIALVQ